MFSGTLLSSQHWEGKHPWELTGLLKRLTPRQGKQYPEEHLMLTSDLYHTRTHEHPRTRAHTRNVRSFHLALGTDWMAQNLSDVMI